MRILVALLLAALPLRAQLRETLDVSILELDVVVVDRQGKTVDGLTAADFDVRIGGRNAAVTNFYAVKRGAIVDARGAVPAAEELPSETMIPTSLVIVVDDTRLTQRSKQRAVEALKQYLRTHVGPATTAMIARFNGSLDVRTRPTERPGPLLAELERMSTEPGMLSDRDRREMQREITEVVNGMNNPGRGSRVEAVFHQMVAYADRESHGIRKSLDMLHEVVRLAGAFDGRKSVLYVSEGLPLMAGAEVFDYWDRMTRSMSAGGNVNLQESARRVFRTMNPMSYDRSREYQRLIRSAQSANVLFYAVDAAGVRGLAGRGVEEGIGAIASLDSMLVSRNLQDGVRYVANETGGRFITNENDLGNALAVISEQFSTWYSLGVRAPASTRLVKVRVAVKNRPQLRVLSSRHRKAMTREEEIQRAVRARLYLQRAENPLGANVTVGSVLPDGPQCVVPLRVSVAGATPLDLYFALLDDRQQESDVRTASIGALEGRAHSMSLGVKAGRYVLSLALANRASGETSYLQHEIDARGCR